VERPAAWKALESFAEYGAWHPDYVTSALTRLIEVAPDMSRSGSGSV
jgi:hypothetical protein